MTQADADKMRELVKSLNLIQLGKLWVWITAEYGAKLDEAYKPKRTR